MSKESVEAVKGMLERVKNDEVEAKSS